MKYLKVTTEMRDNEYNRRCEQTVYRSINTLEELSSTYDQKAQYYRLTPVDVKPVIAAINEGK